jgi:hydroxyethylthiazole kinase-like uncharacterized protein yjeF
MATSADANSSGARQLVDTGYLNAADAAALDEELMSVPGFTLEQLMELAGLAVAEAVYQVLNENNSKAADAAERILPVAEKKAPPRILVLCGPGNNGGDGLVAARHLTMFGYDTTVVYPKRSSKQPHYANLVKQCEDLQIPVLEEMPPWSATTEQYAVVVDAIFGFSFQGEPRPPFDSMIELLKSLDANNNDKVITVAVDVPSGWNVNGEDDDLSHNKFFLPDVLVSLTAPKLFATRFTGRHFVGGRFLPPALAAKYNVRMPPYPGTSQVMEVTLPSK